MGKKGRQTTDPRAFAFRSPATGCVCCWDSVKCARETRLGSTQVAQSAGVKCLVGERNGRMGGLLLRCEGESARVEKRWSVFAVALQRRRREASWFAGQFDALTLGVRGLARSGGYHRGACVVFTGCAFVHGSVAGRPGPRAWQRGMRPTCVADVGQLPR
jgi:hypothetical protein